jgi:P4 family phage/plasmid primase-like protien
MIDAPIKDSVQAIYDALTGKPVLLCIPTGRKGPLDKGWDQTTWEDTQDPEYQANLRRGNVGVMLGSASKYQDPSGAYCLCSIDIDTDEELQPFLALNPLLKDTLVTVGRRGGNIWLWVLAESYPPFAKLSFAGDDGKADAERPWGEWRSEGARAADGKTRRFQTVIWGTHPEGQQYRRVSEGTHPTRVNFKEIVWPNSVFLPWRKSAFEELVERHGQPWFESKNGAMTLNSPFFVAKYAEEHRVLHEPEETRFYDYCAKRGLWLEDSEDAIRWKLAADFKTVANEAAKPQLELKRTNAFLQGLVCMLKGCVEKRAAFLREAGLVHLQNGMLDVRKEPPTLSAFSPDYYSRNQLEVALDEKADCPRFKKELLEDAVEAEDIALLQKWAGQLLLGVNLTQRILLLTGAAGRGKTTFVNVMARIIGQANIAGLRTDQLHQRFELFNYVGKTFLIGADVPGHFLMTEGAHVLKALVGKDVLTAEKKNGDSMTIIGDYNVGLTSNSRLKVKLDGDTDAWRRRLLIVNYERAAPERPDPQFLEKLMASEASGILNWMIEGAMVLLAEIKEHGGMRLTNRQKDRVDSLLAESESVREFTRKAVATADGSCTVTTQELSAAYVHYCEERGWNPLPTRKIESALPDALLEIHRFAKLNDIQRDGKNQRGYRGIRLLPVGDPDDRKETPDATPFG